MLNDPHAFLATVPQLPGVYEMHDEQDVVLYVGKAKNLKKRLGSYFRKDLLPKTAKFMELVARIQFTVTANEKEALLLEYNLIKRYSPKYNIDFRDNKSYPYLVLTKHSFPRLMIYRGKKNPQMGDFFGPFPAGDAVKFVLKLIQKLFKLRVCKDNFMALRSRPCLFYQLKLCSAPCLNKITAEQYQKAVSLAITFLIGKNELVTEQITKLMQEAAQNLAYEQAAEYRDQIAKIRQIQMDQQIYGDAGELDVLALTKHNDWVAVSLLFVRSSLLIGAQQHCFEVSGALLNDEGLFKEVLLNYYLAAENRLNRHYPVPQRIVTNQTLPPAEIELLENLLMTALGKKVCVLARSNNNFASLVEFAERNAREALTHHLKQLKHYDDGFQELKTLIASKADLERIDALDASHYQGENQVVSFVAINREGPDKAHYRLLKVDLAGDDCAAIREALIRRYRAVRTLPNLILIDGGRLQLQAAAAALTELKLDNIPLLAIAKGEGRKIGLEQVWQRGKHSPLALDLTHAAFRLLVRARDEAHRYASLGQRRGMIKRRMHFSLDAVTGLGQIKRKRLLTYFGGIEQLLRSGVSDLQKVPGVGPKLAQAIYATLHASVR